jgi:hypothetical protein
MAQTSRELVERLAAELVRLDDAGKLTRATWEPIAVRALRAVGDLESDELEPIFDAEPPPAPMDNATLNAIGQELTEREMTITHAEWFELLVRAFVAAHGHPELEFVLNMEPQDEP